MEACGCSSGGCFGLGAGQRLASRCLVVIGLEVRGLAQISSWFCGLRELVCRVELLWLCVQLVACVELVDLCLLVHKYQHCGVPVCRRLLCKPARDAELCEPLQSILCVCH